MLNTSCFKEQVSPSDRMAASVYILLRCEFLRLCSDYPILSEHSIDWQLDSLSTKVDPKRIAYADTQGTKSALLIFTEETMTKVAFSKSFGIGSVNFPIHPYIRSHSNIYLKSVPPFILVSLVEDSLKALGKVIKISRSRVRFTQTEFQYIYSFARKATGKFKMVNKDVPRENELRYEGTDLIIPIDTA